MKGPRDQTQGSRAPAVCGPSRAASWCPFPDSLIQPWYIQGFMLLSLSRVRTAEERYEKVFGPEAFTSDRDSFQVIEAVSLAFNIFKDKAQFRLVGAVQTALELP